MGAVTALWGVMESWTSFVGFMKLSSHLVGYHEMMLTTNYLRLEGKLEEISLMDKKHTHTREPDISLNIFLFGFTK